MPDSKNRLSFDLTVAGRWRKPLAIIIAGVLLFFAVHSFISSRICFVGYTQDTFFIQDYAYHVILTNHFWFTKSGDIYDLDFQLQSLSTYTGRRALVTMPVGVTPLALIVWLPFAYIADFSLPLAYSLWITVSIGLLALALWEISRYVAPVRPARVLPVVLCGITVFSLAGLSTVVVGQTSFFAAGVFSFILYRTIRRVHAAESVSVDWPVVFLVILAGIKPSYMIIGFGLLLIYRRWRELFYSAGLVFILLLILTPGMTTTWPGSYQKMLQMYSCGDFPDIYAWSVVPHTMNVFRGALSAWSGDQPAAVVSSALSGMILLAIVMASLCGASPSSSRQAKLAVGLVACCLLFAPYLGAYEDILLIPIFIIILQTSEAPPVFSFQGLVVAGALFICLLHNFFAPHHKWIFFLLKFTVLAGMVYYAGNSRSRFSAQSHNTGQSGAAPVA